MYKIAVIKSGECTYQQTVEGFEEIRDVLEIGDNEAIVFENGMFTYEVSDNEEWNVMECAAETVRTVGLGDVLPLNKANTHVMYDGTFFEVITDQDGDFYFNTTTGIVFIEPVKAPSKYYEDQLDVLQPYAGGIVKVKFTSPHGDTKFMDLNDESASAIVEFLSNNYTLTLK